MDAMDFPSAKCVTRYLCFLLLIRGDAFLQRCLLIFLSIGMKIIDSTFKIQCSCISSVYIYTAIFYRTRYLKKKKMGLGDKSFSKYYDRVIFQKTIARFSTLDGIKFIHASCHHFGHRLALSGR